ncbi:uncharacterized protein LOC100900558 [Galendromus occidentalis]|uniref:Uncharacterized protein LOC100900558 n=1 Tax=Galendromus occidentalis TaxID=34638 RepID=A0AAJ6VYK6_9ACAR|nr:uncharacterized protein LOC100900558 [Galendromus occidentalis]
MQDLGEEGPSKAKDLETLLLASNDAQAYKTEDTEPTDPGIDLDRLAEVLESVPLHERLSLPKDLLLPKQIAEFEHGAAQRLRAFEEKLKSIVNAEIKPDPAYDDLQQVMAALAVKKEGEPDEYCDEDYDDDEEVDPNNVVDWLDKVLSK